jgi:hypothetical protein
LRPVRVEALASGEARSTDDVTMNEQRDEYFATSVSYDALYVGGHPQFAVTDDPVVGRLTLRANHIVFEVMGEYLEPLFVIRWDQVDAWEVGGTDDMHDAGGGGGRALLGGLIAGIPGAVIGAAASRREYQTTFAVGVIGGTVAFLIHDAPAIAVRVAALAIPAARALLDIPLISAAGTEINAASKTACRDRAVFWARLADADLESIHSRNATVNAPWARPTTMAAVAQVWATLALCAPDP